MAHQPEPKTQLITLFWAFVWGLSLTCLRRVIGMTTETDSLLQNSLGGFLLEWSGHFVIGIICAHLFHRQNAILRFVSVLLGTLYWSGSWAAYRYEMVFGHLPNSAILRFLSDLETISSSLESHIQIHVLIMQCVLPLVFLFFLLMQTPKNRMGRFFARLEQNAWFEKGQNIVVLPLVVFLAIHLYPPLVSQNSFWESRNPFLWILQSRYIQLETEASEEKPSTFEFQGYQYAMGHRPPFGDATSSFPLCQASVNRMTPPGHERSILFLIVENLGAREIHLSHQGKQVLPNLARIIEDGFFFDNIKTSGVRSSHAFPPIFAGLPAQASNVLWQVPLPNLEGLPAALQSVNYETYYRHGAELIMEQKRTFLQMVGFKNIIEPRKTDNFAVHGWGYADRDMFQAIQSDVDQLREQNPQRNYLYALATLSTHDPFQLPPDWENVFTHKQPWDRYVEALHYFDNALGEFYSWYLEHEADRGTILIITGDQVPVLRQMRTDKNLFRRFDVPVVIVGGPPIDAADAAAYKNRLGGHVDIPATLRALLDMPRGNCDQGLNLFAPQEGWPKDRILYAIGSDLPHQFYFWRGAQQLMIDRVTKSINRITQESNAGESASTRSALPMPLQQEQVIDFMESFLDISKYLNAHNAFAPPIKFFQFSKRQKLPTTAKSIVVSAQGSVDAALPRGERNQKAALDRAIQNRMEWLYLDVGFSADKVPVLLRPAQTPADLDSTNDIHKRTLAELRKLPLLDKLLTLDEFLSAYGNAVNVVLEVWPQRDFFEGQLLLAEKIVELLKKHEGKLKAVIIQSFSTDLPIRINKSFPVKTALRYDKYNPPDNHWLDYAVLRGYDWVTLHQLAAEPEVIARAHERGLKIMVTDFPDTTKKKSPNRSQPDGLISTQPMRYLKP